MNGYNRQNVSELPKKILPFVLNPTCAHRPKSMPVWHISVRVCLIDRVVILKKTARE